MKLIKNQLLRRFVFGLGFISLLIGFIGVFMPLLPTTPFLLISAWAFLQSSPRAHRWLFSHPLLGPALHRWQDRGAISKSTKIIAVTMLLTSATTMWFKIEGLWLKGPLILFLGMIGSFIVTRPHD